MPGWLEIDRSLPEDAVSPVVRLDPEVMRREGLAPGDHVEIRTRNRRRALARVGEPHAPDLGKRNVRLGRLLRQALKARIGDEVETTRVELTPVPHLVLAAPLDVALAHGLKAHLRESFVAEQTPVCLGAFIYATFHDSVAGASYEVIELEGDGGVITEQTQFDIRFVEVLGGESAQEVTFEDVGGLDREIALLRELVEIPLRYPQVYRQLGIIPPRGVILHGPPGAGKTHLARAVANEVRAQFFYINGPDIMGTMYGETEANLRKMFHEATHHAPSIVFIDELDAVAPKRGETGSHADTRMVTQLLSLLDGLKRVDGLMVIGTTNRIDSLDTALRRPGRFDREVLIGPPDQAGRLAILQIHSREMPLTDAAIGYLDTVAAATHGLVGADLMELCREAGLNALRRKAGDFTGTQLNYSMPDLTVDVADLDLALARAQPSAMRESVVTVPDVTWADIGGMGAAQERLRELVEQPLRNPDIFRRMRIRQTNGIILHGPPGTGKTLLVKAVANACQANFIAVRGPEVFSKWLGESEQGIRQVFALARQVAPTIIFFDQLDAVAPRRGEDSGSKTTERVTNQILAELDGIEPLSQIVVIASTNRLDLLDPAILRPGRFGIHLHIPLPDYDGRREIVEILLRQVPLQSGASSLAIAEDLARDTEGWSGADLDLLCQEAKLAALRRTEFAEVAPVTHDDFQAALAAAIRARDIFQASLVVQAG